MSLATRCSSCQTAFRVVQDQLKISEGWVRCGRCGSVFNALEALFDLGNEASVRRELLSAAPLDTPAAPTLEAAAATDAAVAEAGVETDAPAQRDDVDDGDGDAAPTSTLDDLMADPIDAHIFRNRRADGERSATSKVRERDRNEFSDARFDSDLFADPATVDDPSLDDAVATAAGDLPLESTASQQPDFLRRAEQRARWRSRPMRSALVATAAVGVVALVLQVATHFRDRLAAQWPVTAPFLSAWCRASGCTIGPPRQVEALTVESTGLTRAIGRDGYVLAVALRSRAAHAVALPWVDLTLTDANGRLVARRALSPGDFGAPASIPAGRELPLQLTLDAGAVRVAGYTVEIFYP